MHQNQQANAYLQALCVEIPGRGVGSEGNRLATDFFARQAAALGWEIEAQPFDAIDWHTDGANLSAGDRAFAVFSSPYSLGCDVEGELLAISSTAELAAADLSDKVVLLHGEIAREQLMPKNFVFYNPEEHQHIIGLLEAGMPLAIVSATGRNAALAGGVYPFPLIEDGDFDIPSIFMTEEEGARLLSFAGQLARVTSLARRIPGTGENVIARIGRPGGRRVVVTAHIDAKPGTPGAIDNATGVVILLLLAGELSGYSGDLQIELVALNGEDYYAAPGQMRYLTANANRFSEILLNINIDGAGYHQGPSAYSLFDLPPALEEIARATFTTCAGLAEGPQWVQGDHSIFLQSGVPAIAISSLWFLENIDHQEITHTPRDRPEIVDCQKLVEISTALAELIRKLSIE